jgi:hypothetical protein
MRWLGRLARLALVLVVVQALRDQLSRSPEDRTWFGRVGPVPYDFRVPNLDRLLAAYWNPDSDRLFTDRVLGVGWAVNFAQALKIVNELREQSREMSAFR